MSPQWAQDLILKEVHLGVRCVPQPDDLSCGLCCLRTILDYHGSPITLEELIKTIPPMPDIGVYDSQLGKAALEYGFQVTIYTYNYGIFHPVWNRLTRQELIEKLRVKKACVSTPSQALSAQGYIEYLEAGGDLLFYPLSREILIAHFMRGIPVIAALDMTFLYDCVAFYNEFSDRRATHFVVLHGYNPSNNTFDITDPWHSIPLPHKNGQYSLDTARVINAILLGQTRNDSSIIVIEKESPNVTKPLREKNAFARGGNCPIA